MPTHNSQNPDHEEHESSGASQGFEATDVRVPGVVVFLVSLCVFVAVAALLAYGLGKMLYAHMKSEDGPRNRWAQTVDVRPLGNIPSTPDLQNKLSEMTQSYPTPQVQTDDGNQDVANLHAREDLLLDHYSWVDQPQGQVRIPIVRAMELLAARGLPVAKSVEQAPLMTGDKRPEVTVPLTNGFARTGYELDQAAAEKTYSK